MNINLKRNNFFNFCLTISSLSIFSQLYSQSYTDYAFSLSLIKANKSEQALYYLTKLNHSIREDSLNYLLGYNYYLMRKPNMSVPYFEKIPITSKLYFLGRLLLSINLSYCGDFQKSIEVTKNICQYDSTKLCHQYQCLLQAGNMLLLRKYDIFDSISRKFEYDHLNYESEQKNLIQIKNRMCRLKQKSPFIAATLSALVPGLGKFYAGQKGSSLSAFFANIVFAGMAAESYYRTRNFKSPQFIMFSTLFVFFYTGNIIGSIHSVHKRQKSVHQQINNEILINMHIPVARLIDE